MDPLTKKVAAAVAGIGLIGFLATQFVLLLGPAAEREVRAACQGLRPSGNNKALLTGQYTRFPRPAPDFEAQDGQGKMRKLSEFRGKVVFLNFWATWCPPCVDEVPAIEDLQADLGSDDFVVLALAGNNSWRDIYKPKDEPANSGLPAPFFMEGRRKALLGGLLTNMTVLLDPPASEDDRIGSIAQAWGVPALPETFIIDRQGNIQYYFVNKRDWHSDIALTCIRSLLH